jgi:HAD superfamily hydrolase (TIGR01509 family)
VFQGTHLPTLKAFPGSRTLLQRMKDAGLKVVIGSSADKTELDALLKLADVQDLVEAVTSSDDAEQSKPDPDIVVTSLKRLGLAPDEVIMLGDTRFDIEAAAKAGVRTIALRCGGQPDSELAGASAIYDSPAHLLAHFDDSPLHIG